MDFWQKRAFRRKEATLTAADERFPDIEEISCNKQTMNSL